MILLKQSMHAGDVRGEQSTLNEEAPAPPSHPSGTSLNNFALQSLNYFDNMWFVSYKILLVEFKYAVVLCSRGNFGNSRNCEKFISSLCFYMFLSGITPN